MVAVVDKDKVTLAITANARFDMGFKDPWTYDPEDAGVWRVPNDSGIIVGESYGGAVPDFLRYDAELVCGTLTAENIEQNVIPRLRSILEKHGKLDGDGDAPGDFFFAQGTRCFEVSSSFCCTEVEHTAETNGVMSLVTSYCRLHPEEKTDDAICNGFRAVHTHCFDDYFPLWMIDTEKQEVILRRS